ncbi:MAG TPA: PSD1 and planctomycete cytochrome C domain-containing protein [Planctomycetota bacterium]
MRSLFRLLLLIGPALAVAAAPPWLAGRDARSALAGDPDFESEIRPLLEEHCIACHGARRQKGGLRLDGYAAVMAGARKGVDPVVVPGDPGASVFMQRLLTADVSERMPLDEDPLAPAEIAKLRAWIAAGAPGGPVVEAAPVYARHWSYEPVTRPALPEVRDENWVRQPLDRLVLARLEAAGRRPAPPAPRRAWLRRVSLDLTGLPPTREEIAGFLADEGSDAFERVVDRLLASPHYGERMALRWLDLARYADTHGYEKDAERVMWRWRDWVIEAFQQDMPFDAFTIEQLAGDLLPQATVAQRIATGFHRNTMLNQEGGTDPEEFRYAAVVDRVNTTASVWLGTTLACAQCHNHKYDPFSQEEYYQLFAYFNSTRDNGNSPEPTIAAPDAASRTRIANLHERIVALEERLAAPWPEVDAEQARWERLAKSELPRAPRWEPLAVANAVAEGGATLTELADGSLLASGANPATDLYRLELRAPRGELAALRLALVPDPALPGGGVGRAANGNLVLSEVRLAVRAAGAAESRPVALVAAEADFQQDGFPAADALDGDSATGWAIAGRPDARFLVLVPAAPLAPEGDELLELTLEQHAPYGQHNLGRFRVDATADRGVHARLAPPTMSAWQVSGPWPSRNAQSALEDLYPPEEDFYRDEPYRQDYGQLTGAEEGSAAPPWREGSGYADGVAHLFAYQTVGSTYLARTLIVGEPRKAVLSLGSDDAVRVLFNGEKVYTNPASRAVGLDQDRVEIDLHAGENRLLLKIVNTGGAHGFSFRLLPGADQALPWAIDLALRTPAGERTADQTAALRDHYRARESEAGRALHQELADRRVEQDRAHAQVPRAMVLAELDAPRPSFVHVRGSFLRPGQAVSPGVPAILPPLPADATPDRLGFARWLVDPANPLTPRVTVNRFWEQLFGRGLVATSDDFGVQGDPPTNPELLDWLAADFVADGWSVKRLLRRIVLSAAYRQDSRVDADGLATDPWNRELARGPRFRMPAELLRDQALAIGGLLDPAVGGPSVFPLQPEGIWASTYSGERWNTAMDGNRWRRGLYTFWKRTAPYPSFMLFDAPSRELVCTRRSRTNTPLQALAVLNDPAFFEAAAGLAARMLADAGLAPQERLAVGFELCTARQPEAGESAVLIELLRAERERFAAEPAAAAEIVAAGGLEAASAASVADPAELAAWTVVANVLLNLDEVLTKS